MAVGVVGVAVVVVGVAVVVVGGRCCGSGGCAIVVDDVDERS